MPIYKNYINIESDDILKSLKKKRMAERLVKLNLNNEDDNINNTFDKFYSR